MSLIGLPCVDVPFEFTHTLVVCMIVYTDSVKETVTLTYPFCKEKVMRDNYSIPCSLWSLICFTSNLLTTHHRLHNQCSTASNLKGQKPGPISLLRLNTYRIPLS